ncbi:MAG: ABC transporter ATP-binding protein [Planctomycetota bacterium]|nr:MAG: ABC transporter ATP-binding protein [Planctomycetota bacterium]
MIRIEHLTRRFHELVAVDDVSLHIQEGELLGFLGPNGAGKSTTIKILTGFLPATSGKATVAGHDVAQDSLAVRRKIGYLPEQIAVPSDTRVNEYLDYRGRLKGLTARERKTRQDTVLAQCGLEPMRRRLLGQLSRGYRQRVGLADALLGDPPVLILDEATGGLDPGQRKEVLDLIASFRGDKTVLISSHVLAEIEPLASRVAIIAKGRVLACGTRAELHDTAGRRGEFLVGSAGPADVLTRALSAEGLTPAPADDADGDDLQLVSLPSSMAPEQLLASLVAAGIPVRHFEPRERSLQEIFLELVAA